MNHVALPSGTPVPTLGLGTWRMGESSASRRAEVAAVRLAIDLVYRLFDTAEKAADKAEDSAASSDKSADKAEKAASDTKK